MKLPFYSKLFLIIATFYLLITFVLLLVIKSYSQKDISEILYEDMLDKAQLISATINSTDTDRMNTIIESLKRNNVLNYRITIIDREGFVLLESEKDPKEMENHKGRPEFVKALSGEIGYSIRFSHTLNTEFAYLAIPIFKENNITGAVRISIPLNSFKERTEQLNKPILVYGLIIILLFYVFIYIITSRLIRPIDDLITVASRIQNEDLSARLLLPPSKEYELLYNTINNTLAKIQSLINSNKERTEEILSIISSIQEALIIVDKELKVIIANDEFAQLSGLKTSEIINKRLYEVIKNSDINEVIKKTFELRERQNSEIEYNSQSYYISSSYNETNDTVIVLLYNNTEIKRMQSFKKDLISNVSHELKTPLTAINGFIETLNDEISDNTHRRYLEIIKKHTIRMINIVNDLLTLSSLENGLPLEKSECNINNVISDILPLFKKPAKNKGLTIEFTSQDIPTILCDRIMIEQALINLIDNAIKYTDRGYVRISTASDEAHIIISVEDSGIGIPPQDIDRIFERFYVVNKSRTRSIGGTGLGLSIVKHIIERHNGKIEVKSEINKGSTFKILLPHKN